MDNTNNLNDLSSPVGLAKSLASDGLAMGRQLIEMFQARPPLQKLLIILLVIIFLIADILLFVFHSQIISFAVTVSEYWASLGWLGTIILFTLVFLVGFPPLIGYSMLSVMTGMIYGVFPIGFPLLAMGTVLGSSCSFLVFKYLLNDKAKLLIDHNEKLKVFTNVLNGGGFKESVLILSLIRLCPLPYSLSNGALAAIPGLKFKTFVTASLITSPKTLIHLFVGFQLRMIGQEKDTASKIVDLLSIIITGVSFFTVTYIIYGRVKRRLVLMNNSYISLDDQDSSDDPTAGLDDYSSFEV